MAEITEPSAKSFSNAVLSDSSAMVVVDEDDGASSGDCSLVLFVTAISGGFCEDDHCYRYEYRILTVGNGHR